MAKEKIRDERLQKLQALQEMDVNPYGRRYETTDDLAGLLAQLVAAEEACADPEALEAVPVRAAGRIVAKRDMGKSIWLDLRDRSLEKLQVNIMKKRSPEIFDQFKQIDIGDFLGVEGGLVRSRKGEPTIFADSFELLCKTLEPLPEKWHGLKAVEVRYRRRYLDLASNRESLDTFVLRSKIISYIRRYLTDRKYLEVETPMLQSIYGGASAKPFTTHLNALHLDLFMRISPECYLKRLLVGGMDRVFEINRNFRNEGIDATHNPEFTMLELYEAYADFEVMMEITEEMVSGAAQELLGTTEIPYGDHTINLTTPWRRVRYKDLLQEAGVDPDDEAGCRKRAEGMEDPAKIKDMDHDHILDVLFSELVEPTLIQPTFVTHHPAGLTPLCKRNAEDPSVHDRFEPFVCGFELGNAYSEQNDPIEQRKILEEQMGARDADGATYSNALDEDFLAALEVGMPPAGGLGIGIDRLIMLLTNKPNIREVVLFPTMKPKTGAEIAEENAELEAEQEEE
ncbi:MAG: lysine--tRNA ligase [Planctomycetota bacterium]|jgi:lysyl-tRNA synthetase class 2